MKRFKIVLIILAALLGLVFLAGILAFSSGVQTWAVRRALNGQPGLKAEIGMVSAGLSSAELRDVRVDQNGTIVVAKQVSAGYSATNYLFGHRITVEHLTARDVEVDLRKPAPKPTASPAQAALAPFAGILNAIHLPGEVRVGRIDVSAKVLLPDNQTATVTLEGGGIAPGEWATLKWTATFADARTGATLAGGQASGEIKLRTTTDLRIDALEISGDASATGPKLPSDHLKLSVKLAQPAASAGETIAANVSLARGTNLEPLFETQAAYAAGKPVLDGTWKLTVRSEQLAAVLAGFGLPEVALSGEGKFTYNLESGAASTTGTVDGKISHLEKLGEELAAIGTLQVHAAFDGGASKESAQLGKLDFEIATNDGRKFVTIAAQQKLSFNFKDQKITPEKPGSDLARVALIGVPLAWAQPVLKPRTVASGEISGVFVVQAELDGSRVKLSALEPFAVRNATIRDGEKPLVDRVTLTLSPRVDYTAKRVTAELEKLSISTPDGDTITGAVSANITLGDKPATDFSAQLQGRVAALAKPYLPSAGPLTLAVNAKGRHEGSALQLAALKLQVDREGGAVLVAIETLQPLAIDLGTQKVSAPNATGAAGRMRWGDMPLAWAEPYLAQSKFGGQLAPGTLEVTLAGADAIVVRAADKIVAHGATISLNGEDYFRGVDISTDLNATWKAGTLTAEVKQFELRQGTATLLTATVTGDVTPGADLRASGRGSVVADLAGLSQQPAFTTQLPLTRGAVTVKFDGTKAGGVKGQLSISAQNLVARADATPLGSMELSVEANLDANNSGTVRVPLAITKDGRKSDLLVDGKVGLKPGLVSFNGRITGTQIVADDLQAFSALAAAPQPPPAVKPAATVRPAATPTPTPRAPTAAPPVNASTAKPTGTPVRDPSPVWAGFAGRIELDIKTVKQATTTLSDLRGAFSMTTDRLTIENVGGQVNGNPFKVATILSFDAKQPRPYSLVGSVDVPGFDVGAFLKKADPQTPPVLETTVTITSKFSGTAANLPEFADRLNGQFDFRGSKGVLRALNKKAETTSAVTGLLGLAAGLAGQSKLAEGLAGTSELVGLLKDIQFDSITVTAERGADGVAVIKGIEILAPALRLKGNGRIEQKPGSPIGDSPLRLDMQLSAKGDVANGLNRAHQLNGKTDDKGYYLMATPFTLAGTVGKPDSSQFWKALTLNTGASLLGR